MTHAPDTHALTRFPRAQAAVATAVPMSLVGTRIGVDRARDEFAIRATGEAARRL